MAVPIQLGKFRSLAGHVRASVSCHKVPVGVLLIMNTQWCSYLYAALGLWFFQVGCKAVSQSKSAVTEFLAMRMQFCALYTMTMALSVQDIAGLSSLPLLHVAVEVTLPNMAAPESQKHPATDHGQARDGRSGCRI